MKPTCIFCQIINGELPSAKIYEDEFSLAFLDIHPVSKGHTLVIPKAHEQNIFEVTPESWAHVQEMVRRVAAAIEIATEAHGINMVMNNREHAGQVVDHAHVHLVPRYKGDGLTQWPHRSYEDGEALAVADRIRAAL
jgi:histidine triad (HIT) family protein